MRTVVVGTAGHIDHGKSALVHALTGTHPDRLREERERGITIDLGFAHLGAGEDLTLSFVDVPGHERFVRNMLAGASGIDVVLLVVAADESVMPQTREHLDICRLLGVRTGVVALTKRDLVDEETVELVRLELADLLRGTFLEDAPTIACSATERTGLEELRTALAAAAAEVPERADDGPFRLPVDRVFTLRGFGTVVTGTAVSGRVKLGEDVELLPSGLATRVRGLEVHGRPAEEARAGERVAVNLGGVEHRELTRGHVVVAPSSHVAARAVDAWVRLLPDAPELRDLARVRLHLGTAEVMARVRWAGAVPCLPGEDTVAQLRLEAPLVAATGDRFILRRYSPVATIGGGRVLHPAPPGRLRPRDAERSSRLRLVAEALDCGDHARLLETLIADSAEVPRSDAELGRWVGGSPAAVRRALRSREEEGALVVVAEGPRRWLSASAVETAEARVVDHLRGFHEAEPLQPGCPKQSLVGPSGLPDRVLPALLARAERAGRLRVVRDLVALAGHSVRLSPAEEAGRDAILEAHARAGLAPPDLKVVVAETGLPAATAQRIIHLLLAAERLVRVREGMLIDRDALAGLLRDMASWYRSGEQFSVPDFKDRSGVSRKHAIPLLEHLDGQGFTRRVGEGRIWTGKDAGSEAAEPAERSAS